jgi:acyl carrier protein
VLRTIEILYNPSDGRRAARRRRLDTEMANMLDRPNLSIRLFEIVREVIGGPAPSTAIGLDDDLREMGLTSMGMVKLMMAAEVAFDISIPDEDLHPDNFRSVRAIEAMITRLAG